MKTPEQLATEHWLWLEPLLEFPLSKDRVEYLFITVWEHAVKHYREDKKDAIPNSEI